MSDNNNNNIDEFVDLLGSEENQRNIVARGIPMETKSPSSNQACSKNWQAYYCQWCIGSGDAYFPSSETIRKLDSGMYKPTIMVDIGPTFLKKDLQTDKILVLPDTKNEKILNHINKFLQAEDQYKALQQLYKRGILLWGPQGAGKTMTISLIAKTFIEQHDGLVLVIDNPYEANECMRLLRMIEPNRLLLGIIEEIDLIIERHGEGTLLSMLDGQDNINRIVYLATTNYPERLPQRIFDRPGRFDLVEKIDMPDANAREFYIKSLLSNQSLDLTKLNQWVKDTEGMSIAHIRELVLSIFCLDDFNYEDNIKRLKAMHKQPKSSNNNGFGFVNN